MENKYDYVVVGSGLFGATIANILSENNKKVLVIEKRNHLGGNIYTELKNGIYVHKYGAHIFHTSNREIWNYVNRFSEFNNYVNSPIANYKGELYNLPFNMNTFTKLWHITTPKEAKEIIEKQKQVLNGKIPTNLEEQAISLVGTDIYEKLVKGYTEKQWGKDCKNLPNFIINRLPVRYTFNNNYFNDRYQGIPIDGYTKIIERMLEKCDVELNVNYLNDKEKYNSFADKIIYTGMIDEFYNYCYGHLEYRSLKFVEEIYHDIDNYQGNAVINYTDRDTPYTRIIEHKHFNFSDVKGTIITKEYPDEWNIDKEAYYPINDEKNNLLYQKYKKLANKEEKIIFGGRLGEYKYYNMDQVIDSALKLTKKIIE